MIFSNIDKMVLLLGTILVIEGLIFTMIGECQAKVDIGIYTIVFGVAIPINYLAYTKSKQFWALQNLSKVSSNG